jgi:O-antigen/teichoic acid export membrane protein
MLPISTVVTGLLLARSMTSTEYGKVVFVFGVIGLVGLFGSMGLSTQGRILAASYSPPTADMSHVKQIAHLLLLRLSTCGLLLVGAFLLELYGLETVAIGVAVGAAALLTDFFVAFIQGLGRASFGSVLQASPPFLYLASVVAIGLHHPTSNRIFTLVAASYLPSLVVAVICFAPLPHIRSRLLSFTPGEIGRVLISVGQVYILAVVTAFAGMFGLLALGAVHRYSETAALGISLSMVAFPTTAFNLVQNALYYPNYCKLLAQHRKREAAAYFDIFYRVLIFSGIVLSVMIFVFAHEILTTLFSEKYLFASTALRLLAPMIPFSLGAQLIVWALIAQGRFREAIISAAAQLGSLVIGGFLLLNLVPNSLDLFALAHTVASFLSLAIGVYFIRSGAQYKLHLVRIVVSILLVSAVAAVAHHFLLAFNSTQVRDLLIVLAGLMCLGVSLSIGFGSRSLSIREHR